LAWAISPPCEDTRCKNVRIVGSGAWWKRISVVHCERCLWNEQYLWKCSSWSRFWAITQIAAFGYRNYSCVGGIYFWKFCNSISVFGLDAEKFSRSEAIDGLKSSTALWQKGIKLEPRRNFGFILDGLLA